MARRSEKLVFTNADGLALAGSLELPETEPRAFAIFAHCFTCSKDVLAASRISRALGERGYGVLRFDFTGLGNSEGDFGNTGFASNMEDLVAAAEFLAQEHRAPRLLIGHSLGGAAVLAAAGSVESVRAVATIGAPSDPAHVRHLFEGQLDAIENEGCARVNLAGRQFEIKKSFVDDLTRHPLDERIRTLGRALLVFHSPVDKVVDIDHARRIFEAARHPKSFISLDDADHLLTRREDSEFVAEMLAGWAGRYVGG